MAIKKCKECGKGVSTKATACPNCGARITSGFSILRVLSFSFIYCSLTASCFNIWRNNWLFCVVGVDYNIAVGKIVFKANKSFQRKANRHCLIYPL